VTKPQQFRNPFYVLLLVVGLLFFVTVCGYAVMTVRGMSTMANDTPDVSANQLMVLMDEHGFALLMGELVALAVVTFAAMATDQHWMRRQKTSEVDPSEPKEREKEA
jgi:uncharacterized protein YneF (UPF0154 family)